MHARQAVALIEDQTGRLNSRSSGPTTERVGSCEQAMNSASHSLSIVSRARAATCSTPIFPSSSTFDAPKLLIRRTAMPERASSDFNCPFTSGA
ncbi:hypothetical protein D3C83_62430 [compost metagenome]